MSIEALNGNYSTVAYTLAMFGDDYSDDITTTATVTVDGSGRNFEDFQNYLMRTDRNADSSRTDDVDWIRVALKANTSTKLCTTWPVFIRVESKAYTTQPAPCSLVPPLSGRVKRKGGVPTSPPNSPRRRTATTTSPSPPKDRISQSGPLIPSQVSKAP